MANDLNRCEFIGRLGKDPEMKYGGDGSGVASLSLACGWKTKEKEGTEWIRVVVFGKLAEICGEYLSKGKQVYISGRMRTREYEKDGSKRYVTEVVADQMQMLGGKGDEVDRESQPKRGGYADRKSATQPTQPPRTPEQNLADMDDSIPF